MRKYSPNEFETKWIDKWEKDKLYKTPNITEKDKNNKQYVLDMFPYPSGAGLHVGHIEGYTATDIYSRYMRMNGRKVLHPMGWDAFGLPAENYAIKTGVHPKKTTDESIKAFKSQIKRAGLSYDWEKEIGSHKKDYYKWTQWLFLLFYKHGLVYQKEAAVNWCESCKTVLANEQVVKEIKNEKLKVESEQLKVKSERGVGQVEVSVCERCDTEVVQKNMRQWFFKITDYAERLLNDLDKVDWPESTKTGQRNWIGKSEGAEIRFQVKNAKLKIDVFTTRPDTIFGVTYMVLAPEHLLVEEISTKDQRQIVEDYIKATKNKTELQRQKDDKEKTGVFTGAYAINPVNNEEIPIWIADYVLMTYGTGAIMAVPAHDERDFEFAKKYGLEIRPVVKPADDRKIKKGEVFTEEGIAVNSSLALSKNTKEKFSIDNLPTKKAKKAVIEYLEKNKLGKRKITYKLRDWLISRQRFWGAPIPVLYSKEKLIPLKEEDLPVVLPMDVEFKPTGESPLKDHKEFQKIDKKKYPEAVRREADTMDTFVDSSWYFLRFAQLNENFNSEENPFTDENIKKHMNSWMPVDLYMGGAEHTVLHLLYARFFTKVLFDLGYLNFDEPFLKLRHQGMILGPDHRKMSKRWGNIINPLDVCEEYGADTLRMYEMFMGPIDAMKPWNVKSVQGIYRFLGRVWKIYAKIESEKLEVKNDNVSKKLRSKLYKTVKKVTEDIPELKFNTAIAAMMEFVNEWEKNHSGISISDAKKFLQILAPFAPFITEEIWSSIFQEKTSIHLSTWPNYDDKLILDESVKLPIQVNGKVRSFIEVKQTSVDDQNSIVKQVLNDAKIKKYLDGQNYKVIYIKGKIINFVIKA